MKALGLLICLLIANPSPGKRFANELIEFELPPGWQCQPDLGDWICQNPNPDRQKEAIIILSSKNRGPQDSLEQYKKHLGRGRSYRIEGSDKHYVAQSKYVKITRIQGHPWVDSLQLSGEVPGFYTRYMTTTKGATALGVTFTVAKDQYHQYKKLFDDVIASTKFFTHSSTTLQKVQQRKQDLLNLEDITPEAKYYQPTPPQTQTSSLLFPLLALLVTAIAVVLYRRRKKLNIHPPSNPPDKLSA